MRFRLGGTGMERKLTAILAADVVGYSRLMELDEAGTLAALKTHRQELIDPEIAGHHGRLVKLMGDGALVEFASVVDAVACGKEVAESIHRFINGMDLTEGRQKAWDFVKPDDLSEEPNKWRTTVRCLDPEARECNFLEVSYSSYRVQKAVLPSFLINSAVISFFAIPKTAWTISTSS